MVTVVNKRQMDCSSTEARCKIKDTILFELMNKHKNLTFKSHLHTILNLLVLRMIPKGV
jgi:hypothetical protein